MKRIIILVTISLVIFGLLSCDSKENASSDDELSKYIDLIYQSRLEGVIVDGVEIPNEDYIKTSYEFLIDGNAPTNLNIQIGGEKVNLVYNRTVYSQLTKSRLQEYLIDGDDEKKVRLNSDNTVVWLGYEFTSIEISETATPDEILPKLRDELNKWADLSEYKHTKIPNKRENALESFGTYRFNFYNEINGYMTDYISIDVKDSGALTYLSIQNCEINAEYESIVFNVDKERERKLIELKISDMYNTKTTKYVTFEYYASSTYKKEEHLPRIVIRDGKTYALINVVGYFIHTNYDDSEEYSELFDVVIPIDLLVAETP